MFKIKTKISTSRFIAVVSLCFLVLVSLTHPLSAQSVLQGYSSEEKLQRGMFVSTKEGDETKVVSLTDKNSEHMKGVVVEQNDSPVTISSEDRKIFVATSGLYDALVSNENGKIKKGDLLSISNLSGIAMKSDERQVYIVGRAAADFEGAGDAIGTSQAAGNKTVQFGRIPVDIGVSKNPLLEIPEKDRIPDALQKISQSIADKPVSSVKIYLGMLVLILSAAISGMMLYSGVRSSLVGIGRNPLSKVSIYRGLIQVVLLSLIVFIIGLFGVYLLLKL
jgi:hypothetical protein